MAIGYKQNRTLKGACRRFSTKKYLLKRKYVTIQQLLCISHLFMVHIPPGKGSYLTLHELKQRLQSHFSDGLVSVIGSGLSCAESLPGMGELAEHYETAVAPNLTGTDLGQWQKIVGEIASAGLEAALLKHPPSEMLEAAISTATGAFVAERERTVLTEVFTGKRKLRLSRLIPHMLKPNTGIPIITTNYDRLVEVSVEEAGLGADSLFVGQFAGRFNPRESQLSFCRDVTLRNKKPHFFYQNRAVIFKPHGSLDWYLRNGRPVRYAGDLPAATRLIITPGRNKFRNGYESPFDMHRERANRAIDQARGFLIIGYGFNDDHLETHLTPAIRSGRPTLLLTYGLSHAALELANTCANVTTLDFSKKGGLDGTRVIHGTAETFFPNIALWDLNDFVTEVFES